MKNGEHMSIKLSKKWRLSFDKHEQCFFAHKQDNEFAGIKITSSTPKHHISSLLPKKARKRLFKQVLK